MSTDPNAPDTAGTPPATEPTEPESLASQTTPLQTTPPQTPGDEEQPLTVNPLVLAAIGLLLLAVVPFVYSTRAGWFWMDDASVVDNPNVVASDGLTQFWTRADQAGRYEPLTTTSYWLNFRANQFDAGSFHTVSIAIHALTVILLWTLLRRLEMPGAFIAAALFAVHPVHVQAIDWVSGRSVLLSAMLYCSSMLVYLRYVGINSVPPGSKTLMTLPSEPERLWGLSLILFVLAVLSNPLSITFPVAAVLIIWWKRASITKQEWLMLTPFFGVALAGGIWAGILQHASIAAAITNSTFGPTSILDLFGFSFRSILQYAAKVLVPVGLMFDYPRFEPSIVLSAITFIIVIGVLVGSFVMRSKNGRGPFVGIAMFVLLLAPELGLLDAPSMRYSFVADYRQYLASAALIALVVGGIGTWKELIANIAGGVTVAILAVISVMLTVTYTTHADGQPAELWANTLRQNPRSLIGLNGYGEALRAVYQVRRARAFFERAHKEWPSDPYALYNLGINEEAEAYEADKKGLAKNSVILKSQAVGHYKDALAAAPMFYLADIALGDMSATSGDEKSAIDYFKSALATEPDSYVAQLKLAGALRRDGQFEASAQQLVALIDMNPNLAPAHTELGNVLLQQKQVQPAIEEYAKAVRLDRRNTTVLLNYGAILDSSGQTELASKQFLAATILNPRLKVAFFNLGRVDLKLGRNQDAVTALAAALELDPKDAQTQKCLADAQDALKRKGPGTQPTSAPVITPPAD